MRTAQLLSSKQSNYYELSRNNKPNSENYECIKTWILRLNYSHRYRRQTHVTPKSYLSFIDGYKTIYKEKLAQISELARRMNTGLDKLIEASESVSELSKELVIKEKDLEVASKKADKVSSLTKILIQSFKQMLSSICSVLEGQGSSRWWDWGHQIDCYGKPNQVTSQLLWSICFKQVLAGVSVSSSCQWG